MDNGEAHATQRGVGPFGQTRPEFVAVVVAPARDEPTCPRLEYIEKCGLDPVARVNDDVGAVDLVPHPFGQVTGPLRDVGVGDEQQPHGQLCASSSAIFGMIA